MKIVTNFPTFLSKNIELGVVRCIAYYFREIISSKEIFKQAFQRCHMNAARVRASKPELGLARDRLLLHQVQNFSSLKEYQGTWLAKGVTATFPYFLMTELTISFALRTMKKPH